jgi:alpha-L-fucosidase 2
MMKRLPLCLLSLYLLNHSLSISAPAQATAAPIAAVASQPGLQFDVPNLVGRSDIILARPNLDSSQAMPLGNGSLGVALWSADGLTAQLNRNDAMPARLSPGQLVLPGLAPLTAAKDYAGRLNLYRGEFHETGAGLTATAFVESATDALVIDVTGADPSRQQTASLKLWTPRTPSATVHNHADDHAGYLAESWLDNKNPGASNRPFGTLAGLRAIGRDVSSKVDDPLTVTVSFKPFADGHFRIVVASPHYDGTAVAEQVADQAFSVGPDGAHLAWWSAFWHRAGLIKIASPDGAGEYLENLRNLYLFVAAIEKGTDYPGTQAGIADMISSAQDEHRWDPSAFWHWNLRMQVAANIGAGLPELNLPYFALYSQNLARIEEWTRKHMENRPGVCVPETMRFNGQGIEYSAIDSPPRTSLDCAADFTPYYNARTLSTGAEVSLWAWEQYLATGDRAFLAANYPFMAASARFLLTYQKPGPETGPAGLLHTSPSNAHETQWDVTDPTTDISAINALYPAVINAGRLLGKDADLIQQLQAALLRVPQLPRTQPSSPKNAPKTLLPPSADADGTDVIAASWQPAAETHNIENIGLEPVWPYNLIGDTSPLFSVAQRTYAHRPNRNAVDWSYDPIQAARLGLGSEVKSTLLETTQKYQGFINGMAKWEESAHEFYIEQTGVLADALQEALVQDYDGLIRIAPALPPGWDFDGSVYVRGQTRVDVHTRNDKVTAVAVNSGSTQTLRIRNPWPGQPVDVVDLTTGSPLAPQPQSAPQKDVLELPASAGGRYGLQPHSANPSPPLSITVTGDPATAPKKLGPVRLGLFAK